MKRRIALRTQSMVLCALIVLALCACASSEVPTEPSVTEPMTPHTDPTTVTVATPTTVPVETTNPEETEPVHTMKGKYTLEECAVMGGVFIAYDDGSFDAFTSGGYCYGLSRMSEGFYGMFLENRVLEWVHDITSNTKVVVFCPSRFYLSAYPIHHEITAIECQSEDGAIGYGTLDYNQRSVYIHYRNNELEDVDIQYINGAPAEDYEAVVIEMTKDGRFDALTGFQKDTVVNLGIVNGSSIIEKSFQANVTYFDCDRGHNQKGETDVYYIQSTPTLDGYAVIDFSEIPSGKYVFLFEYDSEGSRHYTASLLNWTNN